MSRAKSSGRTKPSMRPKKVPARSRSLFAHARIAAEAARRLGATGPSLDFTPASLAALDAHLGTLRLEGGLAVGGAPTSDQEDLLLSWGSYLGETVRKRLGGDWYEIGDEEDPLATRICLAFADGSSVQPLDAVREQLTQPGELRCLDFFERCCKQAGQRPGTAEDAPDWARFAASLARAGAVEPALRLLRRATELAPMHGGHWASRGELEAKLGRFEDARASYGHALSATPAGDAYRDLEARLDALPGGGPPPSDAPVAPATKVTARGTKRSAKTAPPSTKPASAVTSSAQKRSVKTTLPHGTPAVTSSAQKRSVKTTLPHGTPAPIASAPKRSAKTAPPHTPAATAVTVSAAKVGPKAPGTRDPKISVRASAAEAPTRRPAPPGDRPTAETAPAVPPQRVAVVTMKLSPDARRDAIRASIRASVAGAAPRSVRPSEPPPPRPPAGSDPALRSEVVEGSLADGLIELAQAGDLEILDTLLDESVDAWAGIEADLFAWLAKADGLDADGKRAACASAMVLAERKGFRPTAAPDEAAPSLRLLEKASLSLGSALAPPARARLMLALAAAISDHAAHDPSRSQDEALHLIESTLTVIDARTQADLWGRAHKLLGNVHLRRATGPRREQVESAIGAFRVALRVVSPKDAPEAWAGLQIDLGNAFRARAGDRDRNVESAIEAFHAALTVLTREKTPVEWGLATLALGQSLLERNVADRAATIERAITALKGAAEVLPAGTAEAAIAHYKLALAHQRRKAGTRAENLAIAVQHYERALPGLEPQEAQSAKENLDAARRELEKKR